FEDGTKKSYNLEVTEKPKFQDITVNKTAVNLSDESVDGDVNGVNKAVIDVFALDQFDVRHGLDIAPDNSKIVVSSNTEDEALDVNYDNDTGEITVTAQKDKVVKDGKIKVNYFENETEDKPTSTQKITVNVTDVDASVDASDLEIVEKYSAIDANAKNMTAGVVDTFDYSTFDAYLLDAEGNRIGKSDLEDAELVTVADDNVEVENGTTFTFVEEANVAQTYLRSADTVTVKVSDGTISKNLDVAYQNSAIIPDSASVSNNSVSVKLKDDDETLSLDQLLFGVADEGQ